MVLRQPKRTGVMVRRPPLDLPILLIVILILLACRPRGAYNAHDRRKVFTLLTMLIANNLNVYKTVYTFFEVFTSLIINNLSVYTLYSIEEAIAS